MVRDEIGRRWRAGIAWLRHSTGQQPQLTLWGWVADGLVALVLTIGAIAGVAGHGDTNGSIRVGVDGAPGPPISVIPAAPGPRGAPPLPWESAPPLPDGKKLPPIPRPSPGGNG